MPHDLACVVRRRSSIIRSGVRATSMPPLSVNTPRALYCSVESLVSSNIILEYSIGKMKFDACPVDPPGLGIGPLSTRTTSRQPSRARWWTRLLPTIPAPMTTALARAGTSLMLFLPRWWRVGLVEIRGVLRNTGESPLAPACLSGVRVRCPWPMGSTSATDSRPAVGREQLGGSWAFDPDAQLGACSVRRALLRYSRSAAAYSAMPRRSAKADSRPARPVGIVVRGRAKRVAMRWASASRAGVGCWASQTRRV